jgi:AraC family transcriptional regulator
LAKIAVELERVPVQRARDVTQAHPTSRVLAQGDGWTVSDMVCASGPQDRPFEERHSHVCIAIVAAGTFQYRSASGRELMTPGSLLLGNSGQCFECGHEHGTGDRCLAFYYAPDYFERLAAEAGHGGSTLGFRVPRLPSLPALSRLLVQACAGMAGSVHVPWEEFSVQLAARTVQLVRGVVPEPSNAPSSAVARVTRVVRTIEHHLDLGLTLGSLAQKAGLSPYHFLRTFQHLTGMTPHQYIIRARLREAAMRLLAREAKVLDIALDCGFHDLSNFNRAFRAEFGLTPLVYRRRQP